MNKRIVIPSEVIPDVKIANYFKPERAWLWGRRRIPDFELIFQVDGESFYKNEGSELLNLQKGMVLCIPPGELHDYYVSSDKDSFISCIHLELLPGVSWLAGDYILNPYPRYITKLNNYDIYHELFRRMALTYEQNTQYRASLLSCIAREIWMRLAENWSDSMELTRSERFKNMLDFVEKNYKRKICRADIAEKFSLSPEYVNYIFKKECGMTPTKFIQELKVREAYRLMVEEGMSIKEVAEATGFCDEFYFSKVFKKFRYSAPGSLLKFRH